MGIPRFLRRCRCVKPIIAEELGRGKRFLTGLPYSALVDQPVEIKESSPCLLSFQQSFYLSFCQPGQPG